MRAEAAASVAAAASHAAALTEQVEAGSDFLARREVLEAELGQLRRALSEKQHEMEARIGCGTFSRGCAVSAAHFLLAVVRACTAAQSLMAVFAVCLLPSRAGVWSGSICRKKNVHGRNL